MLQPWQRLHPFQPRRQKLIQDKNTISGQANTFDREYWDDKTYFNCLKTGHPETHCSNDNDENDTKSRYSQAKSVNRLEKEVKNMKKAFAQLKETKEDSDISESHSSQGESHFQVTGDGLQFTQVKASSNQASPSCSNKHMVAT
jgi:hypothetical protein